MTTAIRNNNLLPFDGEAYYYDAVIPSSLVEHYFQGLHDEIEWKHDEVIMFGKRIVTKRKVAWYGSKDFAYVYSNISRVALPFTGMLIDLKKMAETVSGESFNSCLLNLYHDGNEGMGWHSDDENTIVKNSAIASLSFGAERKFCFRHKQTKESISLKLGSGSLLLMKGFTQTYWHHALPKTSTIFSPRINLTFRTMIG